MLSDDVTNASSASSPLLGQLTSGDRRMQLTDELLACLDHHKLSNDKMLATAPNKLFKEGCIRSLQVKLMMLHAACM